MKVSHKARRDTEKGSVNPVPWVNIYYKKNSLRQQNTHEHKSFPTFSSDCPSTFNSLTLFTPFLPSPWDMNRLLGVAIKT